MAKTIDIELQRQLDKPQTWFCKYYPARIRNVGEKEIADRQLVFDFKDGRAYEEVAKRTATAMTERYGASCADIVFSPVPASSNEKNEIRYKAFCQKVCELTGAINGYDYVSVSGERLTIHENRKAEKEVRKVNVIEFDSDFFNGKSVVVFDDVITKGLSYAVYASQLESLGANVLGGVFLARTHYKVK
ncbi:MAG: ribonucleotide-diphosphate reductase subunit alpha [Prevotellaceae bacterium]|nr:ribonucleotide-diphosphate reductase subunit alpha [Prevotellaceae bacterium]MDO4932035.1 ribonucleotide-diphosphate reductase subunit alpha [Prevotellaceae bacterium]